jgi:hypothetical protein
VLPSSSNSSFQWDYQYFSHGSINISSYIIVTNTWVLAIQMEYCDHICSCAHSFLHWALQ